MTAERGTKALANKKTTLMRFGATVFPHGFGISVTPEGEGDTAGGRFFLPTSKIIKEKKTTRALFLFFFGRSGAKRNGE